MNESTSPIGRIIDVISNMPISRVAIVAVVLTGLYYTAIYDDGKVLLSKIQTAKNSLAAENKKKLETQKVLKKEQQMKADVELLATKFEEIRAKIPSEFLESELRDIVNQMATKNNLRTIRTERRPPVQKPITSESIAAGENLVQQVILVYEFEGSYYNISKFVNEISSLEKLIRVADFTLTMPRGNKATTTKGPKVPNTDLTFRANFVGYKQTPQEVLKQQEEMVMSKNKRRSGGK